MCHVRGPTYLQVPAWWEGQGDEKEEEGLEAYPMDYYAKDGGVWNSSYHKKAAPRRDGGASRLPHSFQDKDVTIGG